MGTELVLLAVAFVLLLALNAFFVLAEFAVVKVRPSQVSQLIAAGDARATLVKNIQARLDEYLSVCQVGITLASVALGMVGEKIAALLHGDGSPTRYIVAIGVSYVVVSGSHILFAELVPKSIAIRIADRAALVSARPLRFFYLLFFPALWLLTSVSNFVLRLVGLGAPNGREHHSEDELRIILEQSQGRGMMSFRRLLFLENVFDWGGLAVRDVMRLRAHARTLDVRLPWADNLQVIRAARLTRYPLITDEARPTRFVHVKDLLLGSGGDGAPNLEAIARPVLTTTEGAPVEPLFSDMQRRRVHMALVTDAAGDKWTGIITLEDILEELVGTIRDEFEDDQAIRLADHLTLDHIDLDIQAASMVDAVRVALARTAATLPLPAAQLVQGLVGAYLGRGIGLPHARVAGLKSAFVMVLRSADGVACEGTVEKARLLFVLLTPAGQAGVHQRLLSIIATILTESEFVKERLLTATSSAEALEAIITGEQAALD